MPEGEACASCFGSFVALAITIPCLAVGDSYWYYCNLDAAAYLYYSGILGFFVAGANLLFMLGVMFGGLCREQGRTKFALTVLVGIAETVRMIWGFAVIFPPYDKWTYTDVGFNYTASPEAIIPDDPYYCDYTPFMFSFVLVVIEAVLLSTVGACLCCACFCAGGVAMCK